VVSNMNVGTAPLTFKAVQGLKQGHAVFTMPKGVIKCPGAGQKVSLSGVEGASLHTRLLPGTAAGRNSFCADEVPLTSCELQLAARFGCKSTTSTASSTAPLTFKVVQGLKQGRAVCTMPNGIIKCPGAGQ
jgi:hypothetical protein